MSNVIIHTHNIQRKAEWKTIHEQSISHYQTINSYRSILISIQIDHQTINKPRSILISIQTDHGMHILACTYTCMISRTQECTEELPRTCHVDTSVYTAHTSICKYKHLRSLVKEQTEHNIGEVCINSLGWYDANTVKNKIITIIIKAYYEIS